MHQIYINKDYAGFPIRFKILFLCRAFRLIEVPRPDILVTRQHVCKNIQHKFWVPCRANRDQPFVARHGRSDGHPGQPGMHLVM